MSPRPRKPALPGLPTATTKRRARALAGASTGAGTVPVPRTGTVRTPPAPPAPAPPPAPADPALLISLFGTLLPAATWRTWDTILRDWAGLPLTETQQAEANELCGRSGPRTGNARELWAICGRRAGKSIVAAVVAIWLACFRQYRTAPGESLVGMVLAADRRQAKVALNYIRGLILSVPRLASMIVAETADSITLNTGIVIEVHTSSYRSVRGYTLAFVVADELAFWASDDGSEGGASETLRAFRPGLSTTGGPLIVVSSPYARTGPLWDTYRAHYGRTDSPIYVVQAPTARLNPSLDRAIIEAAYAADPEAASAEYGGQFRSDLQNLFDAETLARCVAEGRRELPPQPGAAHTAFIDTSGGSDESFAVGIAHKTFEGKAVVDCLREWVAPFDPQKVVAEVAVLLKRYRITKATGDKYAGQWVVSAFADHGIAYEHAELTKSEIFLETVALVNSRQCELLDHARLLAQFSGLQRRTGRSGKDSVDHRPHQRDDLANACAGAMVLAVTGTGKAMLPSDFTACINPLHLQRCPLAMTRTSAPWLPSDPLCRRECPGARVLLQAYSRYRDVTLQAGQPLTLTHATLLRERFDLESSSFTRRAAWGRLAEDLSQLV